MAKRSLIALTIIVTLTILIAGCVGSSPSPSSPSPETSNATVPLEGTNWTLISLLTEERITNVLPNTTITAVFSDGNVTGSSGCNDYSAQYNVSGRDTITFASLRSTLMYCSDPGVMEQETAYISLLQNTTAYTINGDALSFLNEMGRVQLFLKAENATSYSAA